MGLPESHAGIVTKSLPGLQYPDRSLINTKALGPRVAGGLCDDCFDQIESIEALLLREHTVDDRKQPYQLAGLGDTGAADRLFILPAMLRKRFDENANLRALILAWHPAAPRTDP